MSDQKPTPQPSRELCRLLFETAGAAILVIQEDQIVDCNTSAGVMLNGSPAELLGRTLYDLLPPTSPEGHSLDELLPEVMKAALGGEQPRFVWYLSQSATWIEMVLNAVTFQEEIFIQVLIHNITPHKQVEEHLAQERSLLQQVVDHLPAHIYVKDTEGRFVFGNLATVHSLGVNNLDGLIGKSDFDFSPPELAEQFYADEQALFQAGQSPVYKEDVILDHVTNGKRWVATTKVLVQDDGGQVTGLIGINLDITERRQAEEKLRQSQTQLEQQADLMEQVQAAARVGGWESDLVTNTLYWTAETYRIYEVSPETYTPSVETVLNYYTPESVPVMMAAVNKAIETGEPWDHEAELITGQNRRIWVRGRGRVEFNDKGQPVKIYGSLQDITERRRLEQQVRASLERQARQLHLLAQVAQQTAALTDLSTLFERIVKWTKEQLGFYHVQLFRCEPDTGLVKLVSAYGDIGAQLLAANYQVALGEGLVGAAAAGGVSILEPDMAQTPDWRPNTLLPQTRGELVIPIKSGHEDAQAQTAALQHFVASNFDGLIVSVINPELVGPITRKALHQNIPVVSLNAVLGPKEQTTSVSASDYEMGYTLGLQAGAWAKVHTPAGQPLKIAILSYRRLPQLVEREEGMIAGLEQTFQGELELVASETAGDSGQGLLVAERWLKNYSDLQMILGINDVGALGAYQAVIAAGKDDANQFFVGGIDGIGEALNAIKKGGAYQATVDLHPREIGIRAVRCLVSAIKGQSYQGMNEIKPRPVNKTNLGTFLHQDEQRDDTGQSSWEGTLSSLDLSGLKLGMSITSRSNPFYITLVDGARAEARRLGIELVINDARQILGVLAVQSDQAGTLDAEDQLTLEGVAGQVAAAIENIRLIEQANIFQQLAEAAGQGFSMANPEGKIVYNNPTTMKLLGLSQPEENYGHSFITLYPEALHQRLLEETLPLVLATGQWQGELTRQLAGGRIIPTYENVFVIQDEKGELKYLANIFSDISEQKQAEAELQARLDELNTLQRLMSREGWQAFQATHQETAHGYLFDHNQLLPVDRVQREQGNGMRHSQAGNGQLMTKPVMIHGETIAQIGVYDDQSPLTPEDQEFLDAVAEQVAEALERARLLEQAQKRVVELETVTQVGAIISTTLEPKQLLQTVVDLTKTSFNLYHTHIYLLDETGQNLILAAGTGEAGEQMIAQGWTIPLEHEYSLVAQAARTRQGVTVNDVQANPAYLPNPLLPRTRSEMAVPLVAGNKLLGVLDIQADISNRFTREDIQIQTTLATQVAVALENARLFEQTQTALAETETLYDLTGMLSGAATIDETLQTILSPVQGPTLKSITLFTVELNETGQPEWVTLVANWDRQPQGPNLVNTRYYLPEFPFSDYWINHHDEPVIVGNVFTDERLDPGVQAIFQQLDIQALAILPLMLGNQWVGMVSLNWSSPQQVTERDRRLYHAISAQAAVVINNLLLLDETKERAIRLEKLSQIESALSQAKEEPDILAAIAQIMADDPLVSITLQYLEVDKTGSPVNLRPLASWRNGALQPEDALLALNVKLDTLPTTALWVDNPTRALFVSDTYTDSRIDEITRDFCDQGEVRSFALLPLHSAGHWQGIITFTWPESHIFSSDEQFMIQQLLEPVSAVVASRRAYLEAEQARQTTEDLYNATRRINEANDLQEIVAAIAEDGPLSIFNRALLFLYEYNSSNEVEFVVTAANWYSGQGRLPTAVGTRYPRRALAFIGTMPLFFDNIQNDARASQTMQELAYRLEFQATAALPLWTTARQLGTLFFEAPMAHHFTEQEMQPYVALARQVSIALENRLLLEETRQALADLEVTQRRYTVQTWEDYKAKISAKEYEKTRENVAPLNGALPVGVSEAIQHRKTTVITPALLPAASEGDKHLLSPSETNLIVPLTVRDEVIGVLGLQEIDKAHPWLPEEVALVQAIAEEIALAAENIRLLDDTQQRAAREQRVNEIGEKIRAAQTLEEALQVAVKEVGLSLKAPQAAVKLELKNE